MSVGIVQGLSLKTIEQGVPGTSLGDTWHAIWSVYVAESAVGYGDFGPQTHLGRMLCIISIYLGIVILAFVIPKSNSWLSLTNTEARLYRQLRHWHAGQTKIKLLAVILVQRYWRLCQARKGHTPHLLTFVRANRILMEFKLKLRRVKAKDSGNFKDTIDSFEKVCDLQLKKTIDLLRPCIEMKKDVRTIQAFALINKELATFNQIKSICTVYCQQGTPSYTVQVRLCTSASRKSLGSGERSSNVKLGKARVSAFLKLKRRLVVLSSPRLSLTSRGSFGVARSSNGDVSSSPVVEDLSPNTSAFY